ncbi:MAG TPA: hypothetical protein VNL39_05885, partial [Xanthobacteraceae bacterium]|nr:hypothetical protein [Xanthobacteraceae bacterium]
ERFGIPPFSVLDARKGWWQERKRAWIDLGIRSELGRGAAPGGSPRPLDRARIAHAGHDTTLEPLAPRRLWAISRQNAASPSNPRASNIVSDLTASLHGP